MIPTILALVIFVILVGFIFAAISDKLDKITLWDEGACGLVGGVLLVLYTTLVVHFTKTWMATGSILG